MNKKKQQCKVLASIQSYQNSHAFLAGMKNVTGILKDIYVVSYKQSLTPSPTPRCFPKRNENTLQISTIVYSCDWVTTVVCSRPQ